MGVSDSRKVEKSQRLIAEDADCHQGSVSRALYRLERSDMLSIVNVGRETTTVLLTVPNVNLLILSSSLQTFVWLLGVELHTRSCGAQGFHGGHLQHPRRVLRARVFPGSG
jgi:hypothetical protein